MVYVVNPMLNYNDYFFIHYFNTYFTILMILILFFVKVFKKNWANHILDALISQKILLIII